MGTVLSLWDAAELDAAGEDGEVLPKFINLTDASIKMVRDHQTGRIVRNANRDQIEALPTRNNNDQPLQNVLSISTAGKNRYLLHFNSHHSLIQWTAGIRLAMFEYTSLQEAYTGALIAGKGRELNNINLIMGRSRFATEDWVRVRFGAGTPWRRCWCVITPPDEKEYNKLQKEMNKKKSAYDRSRPPVLRGDVKFFDTNKRSKKTKPIATLSDAYCAYAIYPQSKPLIDQSTLIKVEGLITVHSTPETTTEGFVFVMPEVHPAVSGFEMMLRWFFPALDTFALYGRPGKLIAETTNTDSLMFAMPTERRYGYLEILDVTNLILEDGSSNWTEKKWRAKMKDLTSKRMAAILNGTRAGSRYSTSSRTRMRHSMSITGNRRRGGSSDNVSIRSTPSIRWGSTPSSETVFDRPARVDSAPTQPPKTAVAHHRSVSEAQGLDRYAGNNFDSQGDVPPLPPAHGKYQRQISSTPERMSLEDERREAGTPVRELQALQKPTRVEPVAAPPEFSHPAGTLPPTKPFHSPELRRAKSRMSQGTLAQITAPVYNPSDLPVRSSQDVPRDSEDRTQGVPIPTNSDTRGMNANLSATTEGLVTRTDRVSFERMQPADSHVSTTPIPPQHLVPAGSLGNGSSANDNRALPSQVMAAYTATNATSRSSPKRESVIRKPLPSRASGSVPASISSPDPEVIDKAAFEQIVPLTTSSDAGRLMSMESRYTTTSADSPDYASTARQSMETPRRIEGPRAGVLRTVGSDEAPSGTIVDIPQFDFGPTINYAYQPTRPQRAISPQRPQQSYQPQSNTKDAHIRPDGGANLANTAQPAFRPASRGNVSPGPRVMPWQPAMATAPAPTGGLTPEQYVQQRSAAPGHLYVHSRSPSAQALRAQTPTPPLSSQSEYFGTHSRNNSGSSPGPASRPSSRAHTRSPSGVLGTGDMSTKLTAKEQEHVARMTGQPLISNVITQQPAPGAQPGLVGAIDAMGHQKKQMRAGLSSATIEREIAMRQHQQYQEQYHQQQQYPQQYPQSYTQQPGQQAYMAHVQPQHGYAQGGVGWTPSGTSNPGRNTPNGTGQQHYYPYQHRQ